MFMGDRRGIGEYVVHRLEPGRPFVSQPGHLDGSRFAGENQEPIVGGMPSQIEKNIDAVGPDGFGELGMIHRADFTPERGGGMKPRPDCRCKPGHCSKRLRIGFARGSPAVLSERTLRGDGRNRARQIPGEAAGQGSGRSHAADGNHAAAPHAVDHIRHEAREFCQGDSVSILIGVEIITVGDIEIGFQFKRS